MRQELPWKIDANGLLLGASVHDGSVVEFHYMEDLVRIGIRSVSGGTAYFEFTGLSQLNIEDFWPGSIVLDIFGLEAERDRY